MGEWVNRWIGCGSRKWVLVGSREYAVGGVGLESWFKEECCWDVILKEQSD